MICNNCGAELAVGAQFCPKCGEKVNETPQNCKHCGEPLEANSKFCAKCGMRTWIKESTPIQTAVVQKESSKGDYTGPKTVGAYFTSVISAIVSFIIRVSLQDTFYSYENILNNRKVVGLDSDSKPLFSLIPIAAAVIVSLLIVSDQETGTRKKGVAFIVNGVFIALALLCIWFDIPYQIIDF